ncbi:hypothetical protein BGX21_002391 [Mortierella sp. AD011]|nr:hypothetical protein BGX21_002391 [Mortierella sp. AD011]
MDDLPDDAFEVALDARSHVYLKSIISMTRPLTQLQIENEDLESQWKLLRRGKHEIDPDNDFDFLSKHQILELGLSSDFVVRLDLATFAHEIFMDELDPERCKNGLRGFTLIFLSEKPKDFLSSCEEENPLLTIFLQLVILALYARSISSSEKVTKQTILALCDTATIPELSRLSKMNVTPVIEFAVMVSNNDKELLALYDNTLKQIIKQMKRLLQSLEPIAAIDFAEELEEMRKEGIEQLYKDQKISNDDEYDSEIWLPARDHQGDVEISYNEDGVSADNADHNVDTSGNADIVMDLEQIHDDDNEDRRYTPDIVQPSHNSRASLQRSVKNAKKAVSKKIESDSDFEEGGEELPLKTLKRRKQEINEDDDDFVTDPSESDPSESDASVSYANRGRRPSLTREAPANNAARVRSAAAAPKKRKATVHWTQKEISRLMELVDSFRYKKHEIKAKKRMIKWSRLKAYDEDHGNVLRARSQVQLNDKYRELTDNGAHREKVLKIFRARNPI